MDFNLSDENAQVRDLARRFASEELRPHVATWEREKHFPRHVFERLGDLGLLGAVYPEEYGGSSIGFLNMVIAAEEVGKGSPDLVTAFNMNAMTATMAIFNFGSPQQRTDYLPDLIAGRTINSIAITEAGGGSDVLGNMRTTAKLDGDEWVLNGSKLWITMSPVADVCVVFAKTDTASGHQGVSAFILEYTDPGVSVNPLSITPLGGVLIPVGEVVLENVRLPADRLLGDEGSGFKIAMNALDYGRLAVGTKSLAVAEVLRRDGIEYAKSRQAFGHPIGKFQMLQHNIADMVTEIEAGRLLLYRAAASFDDPRGVADTRAAAMAKYFLGEVALRVANSVVEIFGAYSFSDEYPINRYLNLALLGRTGEGSANVLRVALAEDALGFKRMDRHAVQGRSATSV